MTKLNQIIAIEKTANSQAQSVGTKARAAFKGSRPFFEGRRRTYTPLDLKSGERFPDESQLVQLRVEDLLAETAKAFTRMFDVVATKDSTNTVAKANVVLSDDTVLLTDVPVTYLLFLEKRLAEFHEFIDEMPTTDPAKSWVFNQENSLFETDEIQQIKTKKIPRVLVKYEATEKHPAQTEVWQEDTLVGNWNTVFQSGAASPARKRQILDRIEALQEAVKKAREEANGIDVVDQKVGKDIFEYLFRR